NGKTDIWPSWFNKSKSGTKTENMTFDSVSRKLATECTPQETRIEVGVTKIIDPMTGNENIYSSDYNTEEYDDIHLCGDTKPTASINSVSETTDEEGNKHYTISAYAHFGRYNLSTYELYVNGTLVKSGQLNASEQTITHSGDGEPKSVTFKVKDVAGYMASDSR
ncbi:hypothetical protein IKP94_02305, partial [Candidatus Saccharibacteria bacterium]|nr:hypothetical protein [Candidatus Saccharibacteria bacterium]